MRQTFDDEFVGLLSFLFITTKKYDLKVVAAKMGLDYGTMYAYVTGRRTFPVTLLPRLVDATGDRIFLDAVFAGSGWKVVKKIEKAEGKDIVKESMDIVEKLGRYYESLRSFYEDLELSEEERNELKVRLSALEKEIDDLRDLLYAKQNHGR